MFPAPFAGAADLRLDVSTSNNAVLLPHLSFPSANGHYNLVGGTTYQSTITANGNTLGIYYDDFNQQNDGTSSFTDYPTPHAMAVAIQAYVNKYYTTTASRSGFIALNEISSSTWQSNTTNSAGYTYHTWINDVVGLLKNGDSSDPSNVVPAHSGVMIWAPFGTPSSNYKSDWQAIAQNAYIGDERYIDGPTVQSDGYSVSAVQNFYQQSYDAWVNNAGVPANRLILSEEYTNSTAGNGYGANGLSGEAWQAAIECRALAAYNVGFAGYVGYAWDKNAQGSSNDTLISYVNAYGSTMVLQSEIPCWTGNDSTVTGNSWADYMNWTGGLPSTTQFPYDSLLNNAYNVGVIQQQTAANFLSNANPNASGTTITLDGNQSITSMTFNSAHPYTIAPGTGGSLTLTGTNPSITVISGSHSITSGVILNNNLSANLTGNLALSGALTTNGHVLTKSGPGVLTISGPQTHAAGSQLNITQGTLNLNSDAAATGSANLGVSVTGGQANFNSTQHLNSLSVADGQRATFASNGNRTLYTNTLQLNSTGTLDLNDNDLVVNNGVFSTIRSLVFSGYSASPDSTKTGIISSTGQNTGGNTILEVVDNSLVGVTDWPTGSGNAVGANAIIGKYTYFGDTNFDGAVTSDDYFAVDANIGTTPPAGDAILMGDTNFDGVVTSDDYFFIDANQGLGASNPLALRVNSLSAVPEPASMAFLALGAAGMLMHRRRRNASRK